jgi:hypothetical protein
MKQLQLIVAIVAALFLCTRGAKLASIGDFGIDNADEASVAAMVAGWGATDVLALGDLNYW